MQICQRLHVQLGRSDCRRLAAMLAKGGEPARVLRRASMLRQLDQGQTARRWPVTLAWRARRFEPSPGAMKSKGWNRRCRKSPGPANRELWMKVRVSALSPWCAVRRPRAERGGACDSSPRKRSSENWCDRWAGRRSASVSVRSSPLARAEGEARRLAHGSQAVVG